MLTGRDIKQRGFRMIKIVTVYGSMLIEAMGRTLLLALLGLFFACIIGLFFGLLSVIKNKACNIISQVFVDVVRGGDGWLHH